MFLGFDIPAYSDALVHKSAKLPILIFVESR